MGVILLYTFKDSETTADLNGPRGEYSQIQSNLGSFLKMV